jgi:hypothetical protein
MKENKYAENNNKCEYTDAHGFLSYSLFVIGYKFRVQEKVSGLRSQIPNS